MSDKTQEFVGINWLRGTAAECKDDGSPWSASWCFNRSADTIERQAALIEQLTARVELERRQVAMVKDDMDVNIRIRVRFISKLKGEIAVLTVENEEQARLLGMGAERELALIASRDRHERDVDVFRQRWIEKCAEVESLRRQTPTHTIGTGYCIKRYQSKNPVIVACDCNNGKCHGWLNDNYAAGMEEKR